ncbi:MAG: hypothetical protein HY579_09335 [Nitrospinae bacterium]|nr:hypothetical protein [Nitrospinota bacterium]
MYKVIVSGKFYLKTVQFMGGRSKSGHADLPHGVPEGALPGRNFSKRKGGGLIFGLPVIEQMTEDQKERLTAEWNALKRFERVARSEAELRIRRLHGTAGIKGPEKFLWFGSPFSLALGFAALCCADALLISSNRISDYISALVRTMIGMLDDEDSRVYQRFFRLWNGPNRLLRDRLSDFMLSNQWRIGIARTLRYAKCKPGNSMDDERSELSFEEFTPGFNIIRHAVADSVLACAGETIKSVLSRKGDRYISDAIVKMLLDDSREEEEENEGSWREEKFEVSYCYKTFWESISMGDELSGKHRASKEEELGSLKVNKTAQEALKTFMTETNGGISKMPLPGLLSWIITCEGYCLISDGPCSISFDNRSRMHSIDGPALAYPDGYKIYMVHGVEAPGWIIAEKHKITTEAIERETNAEIRRIILDIFGWGKYMVQSGAQLIHKDGFGELLWKETPDGEPLVMVKVKNSTPEPDGTYKSYFLRVPPSI